MINLIWAMDQNWLIGKDNQLPWRYPEDLAYFKEKTHNKTVLMGNNTYLSLKNHYYKTRPLPFKKIYVASRSADKHYSDAEVINNVAQFLDSFEGELWVLGGATIFSLALPFADRLYITWILKTYQGDSYLKRFDLEKDFKLLSERQGINKALKFSVYGSVKK
ncbi:MAG: dihydrofolate reductase [Acholeplasmataceae bacterium]|jgi:dihydrofolate reductase|nr:dihydrofolate reductase [Acholeplasmataceae bacterium]